MSARKESTATERKLAVELIRPQRGDDRTTVMLLSAVGY